MNLSKSALILAFISAVAWGLTGVLVKLLPPVSPLTLTYYRLLIALIVSTPIIFFLYRKKLKKFQSMKNPFSWVLAIFLVGYYISATTAFQYAPVAEVALLLTISPLFVLLFRVIIGQKNQINEFIGAIIAFLGVFYILFPKIFLNVPLAENHLMGNVLSLLASILTASYATLYSSLRLKNNAPDTLIVSLITFILGTIVLIGYREPSIIIEIVEWQYINIYLLLGIFCTAIPTIGFAFSSKKLPPVITASTSLLILVFANLFAYLILDEKLSYSMIIGSFIILLGLGIMLARKA